MARDHKPGVEVRRSSAKVTIDVPPPFTVDGVEHAAILTVGVIILGVIIQTQVELGNVLPSPFKEHPSLSLWVFLMCTYGLFLLLCLMGVGTRSLWRLGDLGQRGSFIALTMYSVHVEVSSSGLLITNRWFIRRKTRRFPVDQPMSLRQKGSELIIATATGAESSVWFSLYPPTVKKLKKEIEVALGELQQGDSL